MMKHISQRNFLELINSAFSQAVMRHDSPVIRAQESIEQYLENANMTAKEKAEVFASFMRDTTAQTVAQLLPVLADLVRRDAELGQEDPVKTAEVEKITAEKNLLNKQYEIESYRLNNLLPLEKTLLTNQGNTEAQNTIRVQNEAELALANKNFVDAQKTRITALQPQELAKLTQEVNLLLQQVESEKMRNKGGGLIEKQTLQAEYQGDSFKAHNYQKGADTIAQVMGMIMTADGTPDTSFVQALASLISMSAKVSDPNANITFTSVKQ